MKKLKIITTICLVLMTHGFATGDDYVTPDSTKIDNGNLANEIDRFNRSVREFVDIQYVRPDDDSKIEFGPIWETVASNTVEGFRLQAAARTTPTFSNKIMLSAKVAYGFRDHKVKYGMSAGLITRNHGLVKLGYEYDTDFIGQYLPYGLSHHNLKQSFSRRSNRWIDYRRRAIIGYQYNTSTGFAWTGSLVHDRYNHSEYTPFIPISSEHKINIRSTYLMAQLEYRSGDDNGVQSSFTITQTFGPASLSGSTYSELKTQVETSLNFELSIGYLWSTLRGAVTWRPTPYPALALPAANLSRRYVFSTFMLMQPMELTADRHVALFLSYSPQGRVLGVVPLFKRLGLCSFLTFNSAIGHLSDTNRPSNNKALPDYPPYTSYFKGIKPYMEIAVGIGSLKNRIRFDYIWRLTYRDTPDADMSGLRIGININ